MSPARTMEAAARQKMMNAARTRKAMDKMHRLSRYNDSAAFAVCEWSSMGLPDASDSRLGDLTRWVFDDLGFAGSRIEPASVDASFRRYFRVTRGEDTYIVMDAPPGKESLGPFLNVARILLGMGLNAPVVLAKDLKRGLLLLSDLGDRQYLDALDTDEAADRGMVDRLFETLAQSALAQPATFVHRDYHSRNLLVTAADNPGILDFQDAVWGPVTYDLVSLLKDCYVAWPAPRVRAWALQYREQLLAEGFPLGLPETEFIRGFDLVGLQRHIKVLGIFARLYYRDGKAQYLKDLPRALRHPRDAAADYAETAEFAGFIAKRIDPEFLQAQQRALA